MVDYFIDARKKKLKEAKRISKCAASKKVIILKPRASGYSECLRMKNITKKELLEMFPAKKEV